MKKFDYNFGPAIHPDGGVTFTVWAPDADQLHLCLPDRRTDPVQNEIIPMVLDSGGWHTVYVPHAEHGTQYGFMLDNRLLPDPASPYNPYGVHGLSRVWHVKPLSARSDWQGKVPHYEDVVYELHIGTFTPAGTFLGAIERLPYLKELGITVIEVMPLAEFEGRWGWGYDGVLQRAPHHHYGSPDELCAFIDAAHAIGMSVILDVVFNHLGPIGNYWWAYAGRHFFRSEDTEWGEAINFELGPVRQFFVQVALGWIINYGFDGLRFDSVHAIHDTGPVHIVTEIEAAAIAAANGRHLRFIHEDSTNCSRLLQDSHTGRWGRERQQRNDGARHACYVAVTGNTERWNVDYGPASGRSAVEHLVEALTLGLSYRGHMSVYAGKSIGDPTAEDPSLVMAVVHFLCDHDQPGNNPLGTNDFERIDPQIYHALLALLLLGPATPMLFQGSEFKAGQFHYFVNFPNDPGIVEQVRLGRRRQYAKNYPIELALLEERGQLLEPDDPRAFELSRLDWPKQEQPENLELLLLYKWLIKLRQRIGRLLKGALVSSTVLYKQETAFAIEWTFADGGILRVAANFGPQSQPFVQTLDGEVVHQTDGIVSAMAEGILPSWSAIFTVATAQTSSAVA